MATTATPNYWGFFPQHSVHERRLTLAPFVDQQWWRFCVSRFDPGREEASLVCLVPKILVEVGVSDLLQWFHIVHRHQVTVQVHELNAHLERKSKFSDC